ncbi:hypothetical protein CUMW_121980 [Citrus unshiu]|nr:hypothetical protein CUMW_121980 [Citrus unshiu]
MEVVVTRQEQEQEHDALHWSRSFKENLCRNYYRNQPARRQLEIPSRRSISSKDKEARTKEENHKLLNGNSVDPADWRQRTQVNGKVLEDGNVHADNAMNGA